MDIFLIILGSICLLVGLIGCIVPMLPGPPIAYVALVLLQLTDKVTFTPLQLFFWLLLVVVIQILAYFVPPWGVIIGPFAGAFIGELLGGKETRHALKAGFGAFIGFLLGTVLKVAVCGWFIFCFIHALV